MLILCVSCVCVLVRESVQMVKFLKPGKVVVLTQGRRAGHKAVIVQAHETGVDKRKYGHAVIAGVDKYPRKVTKSMGKKKVERRSRMKAFVKVVNLAHLMPTRYSFDLSHEKNDIRKIVTPKNLAPAARKNTRARLTKTFQDRYNSGKNPWFFRKLRF